MDLFDERTEEAAAPGAAPALKPITALDQAEQVLQDADKAYREAATRWQQLLPEDRRQAGELGQAEAEMAEATSADAVKEALAKVAAVKIDQVVTKQLLANARVQMDRAERARQDAQAGKTKLTDEATKLKHVIKTKSSDIANTLAEIVKYQTVVENLQVSIAYKRHERDGVIHTLKGMTGEDMSD